MGGLPVLQVFVAVAALVAPFQVQWTTQHRDAVSIEALGVTDAVVECLDAGRRARLKFEFRLCRSSPSWFDSCRPSQSGVNTIEFDSISDSFKVVSDLRADESDAVAVGVTVRREALQMAREVRSLALEYLAQGDTTVVKEPGAYIQVRVTTSCRGSVNRVLSSLSEVLTLGLVTAGESTTEWFDFALSSGISAISAAEVQR